jgi:acyl carrier protein
MMKKDHISTVKNFVVETFLFGDGDQLQEDTSFLDDGIIDSTGILELITFLEETYNITIDDDELVPANFDSLANISNYLKRKILCAE